MRMKLIDWASVPFGTNICFGVGQKNSGVFTGYSSFSASILFNTYAKNIGTRKVTNTLIQSQAAIYNVHLAPADQQPWLIFEEGVTVIPEWAEVMYKGLSAYHERDETQTYLERELETDDLKLLGYCNLYKVIGIKDGWTDNP